MWLNCGLLVLSIYFQTVNSNVIANKLSPISKVGLPFYKEIDDKSQNIAYSPLSVSIALSMVRDAAAGEAKTTLDNFFDNHDITDAVTKTLSASNEPNQTQLNMANLILVKDGIKLKESYRQRLLSSYKAAIESADFTKKVAILSRVNNFVKNHTDGMIPEILDDIPSNLILMLINAVSLDAKWQSPFDNNKNFNDTFYGKKGEKSVTFMSKTGSFKYHHDVDDHETIIEIPYTENLSMFLVLPDEKNGLESVLESLTSAKLEQQIGKTQPRYLKLELPKFELNSRFDLLPIIRKLGLGSILNTPQSFANGLENSTATEIDEAIHQCVIKVDENGTKATAATTLTIVPYSLVINELNVKADHPFMFVIRDNLNKVPIFVGIVKDI